MEEQKSSGQITHHYNREERLAGAPQSVRNLVNRKKNRNFFRDNRSLLMLFANLLLIIIVFYVVIRFLTPDNSRKTVNGHSVTLSAFVFEDQILTTLRFRKLKVRPDTAASAEPAGVRVEFSVSRPGNADAGPDSLERQTALPGEQEEESVLHVRLPHITGGETVHAAVEISGRRIVLETLVKEE